VSSKRNDLTFLNI